ncbi:hypothetical protein [[Eubacterium] cellulosolvens]
MPVYDNDCWVYLFELDGINYSNQGQCLCFERKLLPTHYKFKTDH